MQLLAVCENTRIKAYAHYVFASSIIEGNIERGKAGNLLRLEVKEGNAKEWTKNASLIKQQGSTFFIDEVATEAGMYEYVYRDCDIKDELIVRVDELKNSKKDAILNLAFTWNEFGKSIVANECSFKVGMLYNRILTRFNRTFLTNNAIVQRREKYIRLSRNDNIISAYISDDGIDWNLVESHDIGVSGIGCQIGFIAENLGDIDFSEQYEAWLNMNFVQTVYNEKDNGAVWLDYWNFPRKKYRYENVYFNSFLDIYYDEPSEVVDLSGNLLEYVRWCLNHDYYIAISMDEFYISGRSRYQKQHFFHHNLIYGIDAEKGELYVIGYDKKVVKGVVSLSEFESSVKSTQGVMMRYKFIPAAKQIIFDSQVLVDNLKRFCNCEGRDNRYSGICVDEGIYGIKGLNEMAETERGKKLIVSDNRTTFFLYEYCAQNGIRVDYLTRRGYLAGEDATNLKEICGQMINNATQLKNLVIKNAIKPVYSEQILEIYKEVCNEILELYKSLIACLEQKQCTVSE